MFRSKHAKLNLAKVFYYCILPESLSKRFVDTLHHKHVKLNLPNSRAVNPVKVRVGQQDLSQVPPGDLSYEQTERQRQRQAAAAASPMRVYGDATHDAPNGSQIHFPSVILYTMDPMGSNLAADAAARSVHTLSTANKDICCNYLCYWIFNMVNIIALRSWWD